MDYIIFFLELFAISIAMNALNDLRIFKYAADYGYFIDINQLREVQKGNFKENMRKFIPMLIPFLNIINVAKDIIFLHMIVPNTIKTFKEHELLIEMEDFDRYRYLNKPSLFNALKLNYEYYKESKKINENIFEQVQEALNMNLQPDEFQIIIAGMDTNIIYRVENDEIKIVRIIGNEISEEVAKNIAMQTHQIMLPKESKEDQKDVLKQMKQDLLDMETNQVEEKEKVKSLGNVKKF